MKPKTRTWSILPLVIVALLLAACGGESDADPDSAANSASTSTTNDLAQSPPTQVASTPSTPEPGSQEAQDTAPPASDAQEQNNDPPVTLVPAKSGDASDNPWGKVIPTGPAPTVPPNPPSDFDADGDGMYTGEELAEAIRYRFPEYEWPANYQMTADIIVDNIGFEESPGSGWEAPGEYTIIGSYHSCAWEHALLDAVHESDQASSMTACINSRTSP